MVHDAGRDTLSVCRYCATPMIKDAKGIWRKKARMQG